MKELPSPPLLSELSPSLLNEFGTLSGGQRAFKTIFFAVWRYLWDFSRVDPVVQCYVIPKILKNSQPRLKLHEWYSLCRLYVLTSSGSVTIDSRNIEFSDVETGNVFPALRKLGLITRTSFDPANPRAVKPKHINLTYISFTPVGKTFVRGVLKSIPVAVRNDLLNSQPLSK